LSLNRLFAIRRPLASAVAAPPIGRGLWLQSDAA